MVQSIGTKPTPFLVYDEVNGITIATTDISFVGSYEFKLVAADQTKGI